MNIELKEKIDCVCTFLLYESVMWDSYYKEFVCDYCSGSDKDDASNVVHDEDCINKYSKEILDALAKEVCDE